jgi:hypothetical protein
VPLYEWTSQTPAVNLDKRQDEAVSVMDDLFGEVRPVLTS